MTRGARILSQRDQEVLALLNWCAQMGADEVLEKEPVDWLSSRPRAPGTDLLNLIAQTVGDSNRSSAPELPINQGLSVPAAAGPADKGIRADSAHPVVSHSSNNPAALNKPSASQWAEGSPRSFPSSAPDSSLAAAQAAVNGVSSLEDLGEKLLAFEACGLKATAKNTCFYRGAGKARVMIIGEAPGRDEDLEGRPFVGRAGQLLDRMLKAVDLSEKDVHITNIVYWRPPGNRTPTVQEARVCRPFLDQQIQLVEPEFILLLGGAAAKNMLETPQGIMRLRGKWTDLNLGGCSRKVLATLHPAYLLRTPAAKRLAWRDFLAIKAALLGQ